MPIRPRRGRSRYQLTEGHVVELLVGHPGPSGSLFRDHGAKAVAADAWAELLPDVSRLSLMRIETAADAARRGQWPPALNRVPVNRRPA